MSQSSKRTNSKLSFTYDFSIGDRVLTFAEGELSIIVQQEAPWMVEVATENRIERFLGAESLQDALARAVGAAARHTIPRAQGF